MLTWFIKLEVYKLFELKLQLLYLIYW